jgi:translation elongation factor EF-Tu-like GTPase
MTKNFCAWSASGNREYLRNMLNQAGFMGGNLLVKEASEKHGFRGK